MDNDDNGIDWTGTSESMIREILSQGEMFLQAQLKCALAADQRATTFTSVIVTLSAAVLAGGIALWGKVPNDAVIAMLVMSASLLLAAFFAAWACRPIAFFYPGSRPDQWYDNRLDDLPGMLGGAVENVQLSIDENDKFIDGNEDAFRASLALAVLTPLFGLIVWLWL